ncbi:GNVR domain-containing protein [Spirosoma litoris]
MSITETSRKKDAEEGEIEIRLSDIIEFLKTSRRRILIGALIGLLIGALYAFSKHNIYTAQVTVMPEIQARGANGLGGLGSLAGLAGISLDNMNSSDAIRPDLYPNILQSIPFALNLLNHPVYSLELKAKMPLKEYIGRVGSNSFIGKLMSLFAGNKEEKNDGKNNLKNFEDALQVTKEEDLLIKSVQASVLGMYDKKTGILTITATERDPMVVATISRASLNYLTSYIINYRTEKARKQVAFLEDRVKEAKSRYQSAEYTLSTYRDRNRNLFLNTAKIDEQRLQADYLLEQSVYNELSKQLEQAKIKVQEETPVFKILEPPTVPLRKTGPKRTFIMLGSIVVGVVISIMVALIRDIRLIAKSKSVRTA